MRTLTLIFLLLISSETFSQTFTTNDVSLTFNGLTNEYQEYFKRDFISLIETLNKLTELDKSLVPIEVNIGYQDNQGTIQMIVNYDHHVQFEKLATFYKVQMNHLKDAGSNGFAIYLPDRLMLCLNDFKDKVYRNSRFDSEIEKFEVEVTLLKSDGSWIKFHCYEYRGYRGIPKYSFENYAEIQYLTNDVCQIQAKNGMQLDKFKIWELNKAIKPDGTKSCDYYAYKFFEIK